MTESKTWRPIEQAIAEQLYTVAEDAGFGPTAFERLVENVVAAITQWRPIDTAPKDGTIILGGQPGTRPMVIYWATNEIPRWQPAYQTFSRWSATHWQPLPEPPKE